MTTSSWSAVLRFCLLLCTPLATACDIPTDGDPTEESPSAAIAAAAGSYNLVQANGSALPIAAGSTQGVTTPGTATPSCARFIDAGHLELKTTLEYTLHLTFRAHCMRPDGGTDVYIGTNGDSGPWSLSGSTLILSPPAGNILTISTGSVSNGTARVTLQAEWVGLTPTLDLLLQR